MTTYKFNAINGKKLSKAEGENYIFHSIVEARRVAYMIVKSNRATHVEIAIYDGLPIGSVVSDFNRNQFVYWINYTAHRIDPRRLLKPTGQI